MSLREIAERTGVSVSTVSRALSGQNRISEDVRQKVIEAAREIGYLDGRLRKALHPGFSSLAIVAPSGLLAPSDTNFVAWTIFEGLREACTARGLKPIPITSDGASLDPATVAPRLEATRAEAVAVFFDDNPKVVAAAAALGRPVVLLAGQDPSMQVPSIGIGNRYAARLGTDFLIGKGHRRITLVTWGNRYTIRQREDGFREVAAERGLDEAELRILRLTGFDPGTAEAELGAAFDEGRVAGTTALFCLSDNIALGALRAAATRGIRVPQDLSILGFDDTVAGEMTDPPLTTIHAPFREIGPAAIEELELQARNSDGPRIPRRIELSCTLVERRSCAPPPPDEHLGETGA